MRKTLVWLALLPVALLIIGCAPTVTVQNKTGFNVRVIVSHGGGRDVLSPSPGEFSSTDVIEGPYTVTAIQDQEWLEYAKIKRKLLNDQLAQADKLTGPQLLDVINQLKDIAAKMQQFELAAQSGSAACRGRVSQESDGVAEISLGTNGQLVVSCR